MVDENFENRLAKAILAVKDSRMTAYKVAILYEVNKSFLCNHLKGKISQLSLEKAKHAI